MAEVRILQEDTVLEMAIKIWKDFIVMQSCTIIGSVIVEQPNGRRLLTDKGRAVLEQIAEFDRAENFYDCGRRRKKVQIPNSVGGPVAHKIFRWKRAVDDNEIKFSIWRVQ